MGEIHAIIELTNARDEYMAAEGKLQPEKVRTVRAKAVVDTGAIMLAIPAEIADALGLRIKDIMKAYFADGSSSDLPITEGLRLHLPEFNRSMTAECVVLPPGSTEILLGQIPLNRLDLLADCAAQKLLRRHPDANVPVLRI